MRIPPVIHIAHPHPLPNEQVPPNEDDGWLGQLPPSAPTQPQHEPSWPAPALPGEDDGTTWDPYDPPLYG